MVACGWSDRIACQSTSKSKGVCVCVCEGGSSISRVGARPHAVPRQG